MVRGILASPTIGRALLILAAMAGIRDGAASGAEPETPAARPNIVFILGDDLGRDWLSCYGSAQQTPNLDRLASQGVRFENAWCQPLCTPSRAAFLSGRYPFHTGWTVHHDVPRWGGVGFDPARFTSVARVLKGAGYATAVVGKWQINDLRKDPDVLKKHGFDEHCVWTGVEDGNPPALKRYHDAYLQTNGSRKTHSGEFGPDILQAFARDFIRDHKEGPFFLYYPLVSPHGPLEAVPGHPRKAGDQQGLHSDLVADLDAKVGEISTLLDELKLAENTVFIFAGDNGSAVPGTLGGRRVPAGKGKTIDLGVHIPFIVRAPKLTKGGVVTPALADFTDLYPTLVELAGAKVPAGIALDGHSLVPVIAGKAAGVRDWNYAQYKEKRTVRDLRFKLDNSGAFFDLKADPLEKADLRGSTAPEVAEARNRLAKVLAGIPPDAPPPFPEFRIDGFGEIVEKKGKSANAE